MEIDSPRHNRTLCLKCLQPGFSCYCHHLRAFDSKIKFVILIHPIEAKRRIATGRMSHLSLINSELIPGVDYTNDPKVNAIINDPRYHSVVLYPKGSPANLSTMAAEERLNLFPKNRDLAVFVIDGTWRTARKTMHQSQNLKALPRICFSSEQTSTFRVRKQPAPECFSTIEAIHHAIELIGPSQGFDPASREHDKLLFVFGKLVEQQLGFIEKSKEKSGPERYRRALPTEP